jgi:hypothetical protein
VASILASRLTYALGHLKVESNAALVSTDFPVLSTIARDFSVVNNAKLTFLSMPALINVQGAITISSNNFGLVIVFSPVRTFEVLCDGGSGDEFADLQGCTRVNTDRQIASSTTATTVTASLLTYMGGHLLIQSNTALATIILPSLSAVVRDLRIQTNAALTFAHLPKLTFIGGWVRICSNNAAFLIPSNPPNAPAGGLVVTGGSKGQSNCYLQQGSSTCSFVICP